MSLITSRFLRDGRGISPELEDHRVRIEQIARGYGLDFFETIFEMCTYEEINMIASYGGFPTRYPHWRFGMEYLQMQKSYEYGLSKIYEMVINTDPAYAYLMDCNLLVDQKLVMAHVYGHTDFFKNNLWFAHTNRKMLDQVANHATQIRRIMDREGQGTVEAWIDLCMSLDNLIDPYSHHIRRHRPLTDELLAEAEDAEIPRIPVERRYMDRHINPKEYLDAQRQRSEDELKRLKSFPEEPVRDVLSFLHDHAPMTQWQAEVVAIIRDEAYYFAPQGQTKIMNEGWATYWHTFMMTHDILDDAEVIDYADHHSGTVQQQPGRLNPYKMGVELYRHIEERWDKGRHGKAWLECENPVERKAWDTGAMQGREKIFEIRRTHNDVTFLDTFLTEQFCREQGFFTTTWDPKAREWVIDSREFKQVKQGLLQMLATRGNPRIYVVDANHGNRGELRMSHVYEGLDLQLEWAATTLDNLTTVWGRPVHLDTSLEGRPIRLSHDGSELRRGPRPKNELDETNDEDAATE